MNHIELYEKLLKESFDYEERALIRQFYAMEIEKANITIAKIKSMIDSKTNCFMKSDD